MTDGGRLSGHRLITPAESGELATGIKAGRMLTEALAAPPHARNQAAPTCPICAAGKPAADGKIWQSARNQPSVA